MARLTGVSVSRLQHLFKNEFGVSINQYVKNLRLQKARELLETTHLRVQEIRVAVGYSHDTHFVTDFKNTYGQTPTEYRKNMKIADLANKIGFSGFGKHGKFASHP